MDSNLNNEELRQVLQAMRILAPDIGEDRFQVIIDAQELLLTSGFLEAVWGIVRLQEEENTNLPDAIDRFQQLIAENKKLIARQASLKEKLSQDQEAHRQVLNDIAIARKDLESLNNKLEKGKNDLAAITDQAETEKKRIDSDLDKYRQKAVVTQNEVKTAGLLKSVVNKCGFSLETMLDIAKEFAPYQDARERLSAALEKEESLTRHIASLQEKINEQEKSLAETKTRLESQKIRDEDEIKNLKNACHRWEIQLNHLQADVEEEQQLRQFWVRYQPSVHLLECLAGWKQILFLRCDNPGCEPFGGINHFWSEKQATKCPHCGSSSIYYDEELYDILNLEMSPYKLTLGQYDGKR